MCSYAFLRLSGSKGAAATFSPLLLSPRQEFECLGPAPKLSNHESLGDQNEAAGPAILSMSDLSTKSVVVVDMIRDGRST